MTGKHQKNKTICCVPQCSNRAFKNPTLSFHNFPIVSPKSPKATQKRDSKRRLQWILALRIGKDVTGTMKVCSEHFKKTDFIFPDGSSKRPCLKSTAVPSQHLPMVPTDTKEKQIKVNKKVANKEKKHAASTRCSKSKQLDLEKPEPSNVEIIRVQKSGISVSSSEEVVGHGTEQSENMDGNFTNGHHVEEFEFDQNITYYVSGQSKLPPLVCDVTHEKALESAKTLLRYMESQNNTDLADIITVRRYIRKIREKSLIAES